MPGCWYRGRQQSEWRGDGGTCRHVPSCRVGLLLGCWRWRATCQTFQDHMRIATASPESYPRKGLVSGDGVQQARCRLVVGLLNRQREVEHPVSLAAPSAPSLRHRPHPSIPAAISQQPPVRATCSDTTINLLSHFVCGQRPSRTSAPRWGMPQRPLQGPASRAALPQPSDTSVPFHRRRSPSAPPPLQPRRGRSIGCDAAAAPREAGSLPRPSRLLPTAAHRALAAASQQGLSQRARLAAAAATAAWSRSRRRRRRAC